MTRDVRFDFVFSKADPPFCFDHEWGDAIDANLGSKGLCKTFRVQQLEHA